MTTMPAPTTRAILLWIAVASLAACSGGVSSTDTTAIAAAAQFTVGGTVTGLSGSYLVLENNGGDDLRISVNGSFSFVTSLITGDSYSVSVLTQPSAPNQTCAVSQGSGTVGSSNVTGIAISCSDKTTTTDTIGGTATGVLGSGLVLQNNNGDNLGIAANGPFTFAASLQSAAAYAISVLSPPVNPYQDCAIARGAGTTASSDVTNISVSCKTNANSAYTIGGTVSGVSGAGAVVLQDNGRDNLTLSSDGAFQFALPIPSGSTYNVTALQVSGAQSQACAFTNATGTVGAGNVTNVAVVCKANAVVSLTVSGLTGSGLVLQNNGADDLAVTKNGAATFATAVTSGSAYQVSVLRQPANPAQNCVVTNPVGTAVAGSTTPVSVACTTLGYTVAGVVGGLAGASVTLQDNGTDNLTVTTNGVFVFATPVPSGATYNVSVLTQPTAPYQTCMVNGGTGPIAGSNITNVAVSCTTNSYTVGGTVSGLITDPTTGSVPPGLVLQVNGGTGAAIPANGAFTLPGTVASGASYTVTVSGQPVGYACAVTNGTGAIINLAVNNIGVACSPIGAYLYVTNGGGNTISGFAVDVNTGALQPLTRIVAPAGQPNAIIATTDMHPSSMVSGCNLPLVGNSAPASLYVANSASGTVGAYAVNTSTNSLNGGTLALITTPAIAAHTTPDYLDFVSRYCAVLALNSGSSDVSGYLSDVSTRALTAAPGSPFPIPGVGSAPSAAANVIAGPNSTTYEYVASQVTNTISAYSVTSNGALTFAASPPPPNMNPIATGLTPSALAAEVLLTNMAGVNLYLPYVYAANQASNDILIYQGDYNSGVLSALGSPVTAGNGPTAMQIIVAANLLYVANGVDNTVSAYSITNSTTNTGTLTALATSTAGAHPVALTYITMASGTYPSFGNVTFLYVVDNQSDDVYAYQVTATAGPSFGALTFVGKFAVGSSPTSISIPFNASPPLG